MSERTCCFYFRLRSGALAIGITLLVLGAVAAVSGAVILTWSSQLPDDYQQHRLQLVMVLQAGAGALQVIFSSLLIHGVRRSRPGMLLAWLIYHGVYCGLQAAGFTVCLAFALASSRALQWAAVFCGVLVNFMFWRWLAAVWHYYRQLREQLGETHSQLKDVVAV